MDPPKFAQSPPKLSFWGCFPGLRGVHFGEAERDLWIAQMPQVVCIFDLFK